MLYLTIAGAVQIPGFLLRFVFRHGGQLSSPQSATAGIAGTLASIIT